MAGVWGRGHRLPLALALSGVLMGLLGDGRAAEPASLSRGPRFQAAFFQTVPVCLALGVARRSTDLL